MKIYAVVFFETNEMNPLDYKIYTDGSTRYEKRFINEFVEFGRKDFLRHMNTSEDQFIIELGNGAFLIYITIVDNIGVALLLSDPIELDTLPHLVSKKLILDYTRRNYIPETSNEILQHFKTKQIMSELDENKKVLLRSISKIIERGERIEDLVEKTESLSVQSKLFFKNSRQFNSCCWIFPRPRWKK